jgi:hypothetical protein
MKARQVITILINMSILSYGLYIVFKKLIEFLPVEFVISFFLVSLVFALLSKKEKSEIATMSSKDEKRIMLLKDHEPPKFIKFTVYATIFSMLAIIVFGGVEQLLNIDFFNVIFFIFIFIFVISVFILFFYQKKYPDFEKYFTINFKNWFCSSFKPSNNFQNEPSRLVSPDPIMDAVRSNAEKQFKK